jgi:TrmH family RNA methyltransferase
MATGPSIERLNALPVFDNLKSAVKDCQHVVGFTARAGKDRKSSIKIEDLGTKLDGKVALVFGREDFCLLKEEVDVCTHLCALDSNPKFPALNLSHSVAVVLSQLFLQENHSRRGYREIATVEEVDPMFEDLRASMISVGLDQEGNPERMLTRLRKIFQRADLSRDDIALLRGYFRKISDTVTR